MRMLEVIIENQLSQALLSEAGNSSGAVSEAKIHPPWCIIYQDCCVFVQVI
jgi:hypothetical protein